MKKNEDKAKVAFYEDEAREFVKAHPDYEPNPQNRDKIFDRLKAKSLDLSRENLAAVWEEMKAEA